MKRRGYIFMAACVAMSAMLTACASPGGAAVSLDPPEEITEEASAETEEASAAAEEAPAEAEEVSTAAGEASAEVEAPAEEAEAVWMWIDETNLRDPADLYYAEKEILTEQSFPETFIDALSLVDWDNDGEPEYCYHGNINLPGIYFDLTDGELTAVTGFGPYGMGWSGVTEFDGACRIYEVSGNMARLYAFYLYDKDHHITDTDYYQTDLAEFAEDGEDHYSAGKDPEHMNEITKEDFDAVCGEDALKEPPAAEETDVSSEMLEQIKEFCDGERPVLIQ